MKPKEEAVHTCLRYEDLCIESNTTPSPQMYPWCQSPSSLGPYTWQDRERELVEAAKKVISGWQIRNNPCLYA